MSKISKNILMLKERIAKGCAIANRDPDEIKLIAVSKNIPTNLMKEAYDAGLRLFGENYAQEFRDKTNELKGLNIEWHFIGHLQRNKIKYIVPFVSCIHSIDSIKLAEEINKRAHKTVDCLIEVNLAKEASKTGISPDNVLELIEATKGMDNLHLRGLMTMPPYDDDPEKSRPYFLQLGRLLKSINEKSAPKTELVELSMGMTNDLEVAIEEGATMIRVGTAIFGERAQNQ